MRSDGHTRCPMLLTAVYGGNQDAIKALLDAKADPNSVEEEQVHNERGYNMDMRQTSLHVACKKGDLQTVALLLQSNADINAVRKDMKHEDVDQAELSAPESGPSKSGKSKRMVVQTDDPREEGYVCPIRCIKIQETALHIAIQAKHKGLVALLACAGSDTSLTRSRGESETATTELCADDASLLDAVSASWPLAGNEAFLADGDLQIIETVMSGIRE